MSLSNYKTKKINIRDYTEYVEGKFAGVFGWDGDYHSVLANYDGSFEIRDDRNIRVGFGIFNNEKSYVWYNHSGYLPALVTEFEKNNCNVKIINFADKISIKNKDYVVVYSRIIVKNNIDNKPINLKALESKEFIKLSEDISCKTNIYDFAITVDRFGNNYPWPSDEEIIESGTWDEHFAHMKNYWDNRLNEIVQLKIPDKDLENAYKAGYIYTHIVKHKYATHVGANGYGRVYDHDATGILAAMFTIGDLKDAKNYLSNLPVGNQYNDATWKYPWPWALYLLKTDDKAEVIANWKTIKFAAHKIADDRQGINGIMKITPDIDSDGHWTVDNWSALTGLLAYRFLCDKLGYLDEKLWAENEYNDLLNSINKTLNNTLKKYKINYLPTSMTESNDYNRTKNPQDANWAAHLFFGRWPWDGWLLGGKQEGISFDLIDKTYEYGFNRLAEIGIKGRTFGGYPTNGGWFGTSTSYNAGYCSAALRGEKFRSAGIEAYKYMIDNTQSGPFSWWENCSKPEKTAWNGMHPSDGSGSCPHMWGQSSATKVLVESLIAEFYNGDLIIGRGIPNEWISDAPIEIRNFPISDCKRFSFELYKSNTNEITLKLSGDKPKGKIIINLEIFKNNLLYSSAGLIDSKEGSVIISEYIDEVKITLIK